MRILFMGTPELSVPTLESLAASKHEVIGVVTQPDKPKGRGKEMSHTPVKEKALELQIPVYQPVKVREPAFIETIRALSPDVIVVIAFGQILPKSLLSMPRYGCINIHASLLPKLRGAAPIQWAIINGEAVSGITTMQMDAGIDTGDMLLKEEIVLDKKETGGSLYDKLSKLGGSLILQTLSLAEEGGLSPIKQEDSLSSYAKMLDKKMGEIDFSRPAIEIERLIRGLNPWPSAYTKWDGKTLKIWDADVVAGSEGAMCGEIIEVTKDSLVIQTKKEALSIKELQLEGKKRMKIDAFLRGCQINKGEVLKSNLSTDF
ncbi:MAG: methionyl-tRNA formyltransferase [Clostridiales bacterium]|nr:methionyl-tRNA formyltransferase [Clostridiales bacterium]